MKTQDLAARHIGQHIDITSAHLRVDGICKNITIKSRTISDDNIYPPEPPETHMTSLIVTVGSHELYLHGDEEVTILDRATT